MRQNEQRRAQTEVSWLMYYNRRLLDCGIISSKEYRRMKALIYQRKGYSKQTN